MLKRFLSLVMCIVVLSGVGLVAKAESNVTVEDYAIDFSAPSNEIQPYYNYTDSHCLCEAVALGKVEFRDVSEKYCTESRDVTSYAIYDRDSNLVFPDRYQIASTHAVSKLVSQFVGDKDFTIFVFLPSNYTLKLNGLEYYIKETGTKWNNLQDSTRTKVELLSTTGLV